MKRTFLSFALAILLCSSLSAQPACVRINLLGYRPGNHKSVVWCSSGKVNITEFKIIYSGNGAVVYTGKAGQSFGAYDPFQQTYRLDFSDFKSPWS